MKPSAVTTGSVRSPLLEGRRALVTGAAGAIGTAVATAFEVNGATVVRTDLIATAEVVRCDLTDEVEVENLFDIEDNWSDIVHSAGVLHTGAIAATSSADFRRVLEVNLTASFLVAREAARRLPSGGTLTLLSSQAGLKGAALWGSYSASKFGVVGLGQSLAQELAPRGVRVNVVCPGTIATPMTSDAIEQLAATHDADPAVVRDRYVTGIPLGRMGEPADVAGVCVLLASPLASFVAGASIVVDGGELS